MIPASSSAATFTVTSTSDAGAGSLRAAITSANGDTTADTINFSLPGGPPPINLATPLPPVVNPLTINAAGQSIVINSSYSCSGSSYALDTTDSAAVPTRIFGVVFNDVCGRAIRSNIPAPSIQVGPRRADNTVSINGGQNGSQSVEIFRADSPADPGEASSFFQSIAASGGLYAYPLSTLPTAGAKFVATGTTAAGTSGYSATAVTPSDLTSPTLINAVAVSTSRVRLDFNESVAGASPAGSAFSLGIGATGRAIVGTQAYGNSIFLDSSQPWGTGEAGGVALTGNGRVTDVTGNEVLGTPTATVYAGPGEINGPVISSYRFSPQKFCQRKSKKCKRSNSYAYMTLNKESRVIFRIYKGISKRRSLVTFVRHLKAGRNKVKLGAVVSGRTLPASVMTLRAIAEDVARTDSVPVDAVFRVVKTNKDL